MQLFEIAFLLKKSVSEISQLSYEEYVGWTAYLNARPSGWQEDNRTALIMGAFGVKAKPAEIFPSLARMNKAAREMEDDKFSLKSSGAFRWLLGASGGDSVEWLNNEVRNEVEGD